MGRMRSAKPCGEEGDVAVGRGWGGTVGDVAPQPCLLFPQFLQRGAWSADVTLARLV